MVSDKSELQVDTKDILFICGGAFIELEKTIAER
jgi:ATP-dependent Clp protease ATP-binding subunit ClpX